MERGSFSPDELPRTTPEAIDELIDRNDRLAHFWLDLILKEIRSESDSPE